MGIKGKLAKDLKVNPNNPRRVTDEKLKQLGRSMDEFGDISGIVFNVKTGNLIGGNQRSKELDAESEVVIEQRFKKPTEKGTVAVGYVTHRGERFSYREVDWTEVKESAAMIAANKNAGEWNPEELTKQLKNLANFDTDFDVDLTMFDEEELALLLPDDTAFLEAPPDEDDSDKSDKAEKAPSKLIHTCPKCGNSFR